MKIIKSIATIVVWLFATTLLHAQELKAETVKPVEAKIPAAANKPSPQPELKPQPQVTAATEAPATAAEAPSPLTRKEDANLSEKAKQVIKKIDDNDVVTSPGGEEGKKIMAGKTNRPKDAVYSPSTIDPKPAPQIKPAKPANGQQQ